MRDARRIQERSSLRLDRAHVVWLTFGVVVALGASFASGMLIGRRAARIESGAPALGALELIDAEHQIHNQMFAELQVKHDGAEAASSPGDDHRVVSDAGAPAVKPVAPVAVERPRRGASERREDGSVRRALDSGPPEPGAYTVQVSAFPTEDEAKAYAAALRRKGYSPFVVAAAIPGKGMWYRVRMGAFKTESQAAEAKQLLARSDIAAWVLKSSP